jgi:hypothetical protein
MDTKKVSFKGNLGNLLNYVNSKDGEGKLKKGKDSLVKSSKDITANLSKFIEDQPQRISSMIKSLKNEKIKNLEKLLRVDKSELIVSNRKNRIYRSEAGNMYIIDKDMWGEPVAVTIKDEKKVVIRCIKYLDDTPFLFPVFNEKNIKGKIINMTPEEIWYQDSGDINVVSFKGESMESVKIKIPNIKAMSQEKLFDYINNFKLVYKNKKLHEIILDKGIKTDDVLLVRSRYIIGKDPQNNLKVYLFDDEYKVYDELPLIKMPSLDTSALDVLFSKDILEYIKSNNYSIEKFKQNGNFIEYWQTIGDKDLCVMRYKV